MMTLKLYNIEGEFSIERTVDCPFSPVCDMMRDNLSASGGGHSARAKGAAYVIRIRISEIVPG
jgi:hypothetical protein